MRKTVALATAVVAATVALVAVPVKAYAATDRNRVESAYNTTPSKSATANCDPGDVLIGAGARIINGGGAVVLAAMVPGATSVTARGESSTGNQNPWSVVAVAVCRPASEGTPQIATSGGGSTATCPNGTYLSGTGFELPDGSVLHRPDSRERSYGHGAHAVHPRRRPRAGRVRGVRTGTGPVLLQPLVGPESLQHDHDLVTARENWQYPHAVMSGVGGSIAFFSTLPIVHTGVFIDGLVPSEDCPAVRSKRSPSTAAARPCGPWAAPNWRAHPTPTPGPSPCTCRRPTTTDSSCAARGGSRPGREPR